MAEVGKRIGSEGRKGFFSCRLLSARFSAGRAQPPVACDSHFNSEPPGGPWFSFPMMEHQPSSFIQPPLSASSLSLSLSLLYRFFQLSLCLFLIPSRFFYLKSLVVVGRISSLLVSSPLQRSCLSPPSYLPPPLTVEKLSEASRGTRGTRMNRTVCRLSRLSHRESNKSCRMAEGWTALV